VGWEKGKDIIRYMEGEVGSLVGEHGPGVSDPWTCPHDQSSMPMPVKFSSPLLAPLMTVISGRCFSNGANRAPGNLEFSPSPQSASFLNDHRGRPTSGDPIHDFLANPRTLI